jgi:hypothetical protein
MTIELVGTIISFAGMAYITVETLRSIKRLGFSDWLKSFTSWSMRASDWKICFIGFPIFFIGLMLASQGN